MMPGLDGYGVLEELRKDTLTSTIPFIFLTARTDRVDVRQGMELGADDFLTKPFHAAELLATVRTRLKKREAQQAETNEAVGQVTHNIIVALPHELRTPLNIILGFSDLMMLDAPSMDAARIAEMAHLINNGALRLLRVIENFLLFAQTEVILTDRHQIEEFRKHYGIYPHLTIARNAKQQATPTGRTDDLRLELEEVDAVSMSEEFLKKITEELIDNACKFSEEHSSIEIKGKRDGDFYVVSVTNSGRGMTREQILKIGAYMQFERRIYEQQGMGLGLVICKRLIEMHGGGFSIESVPGETITVQMRLPIKDDALAPEKG